MTPTSALIIAALAAIAIHQRVTLTRIRARHQLAKATLKRVAGERDQAIWEKLRG
ncbi:hypothetical protein SAMN06295912_102281 [Sphingomonas laterariae]|uniref:Uncharacterized protein n=1 Tax=Edaphosphingomonas laterariae TaxID=861865 RepID=A0A239CM87_9SPHN|nr:hypothetical protein [Sphingomonas laterariae]SNS21049.1 hypothetical protein SAMN06295912_102281 [Sphingomonas laterariae]